MEVPYLQIDLFVNAFFFFIFITTPEGHVRVHLGES